MFASKSDRSVPFLQSADASAVLDDKDLFPIGHMLTPYEIHVPRFGFAPDRVPARPNLERLFQESEIIIRSFTGRESARPEEVRNRDPADVVGIALGTIAKLKAFQ